MTCPYVRGDTTQYCALNCNHDAQRIVCPTCNGTQQVTKFTADKPTRISYGDPCPDCVDGKMSHERAWAIAAGVANDVDQYGSNDWKSIRKYFLHAELRKPC